MKQHHYSKTYDFKGKDGKQVTVDNLAKFCWENGINPAETGAINLREFCVAKGAGSSVNEKND